MCHTRSGPDSLSSALCATVVGNRRRAIWGISNKRDILPRARGLGEKVIQEADGYRQEVIARAEGDANRFLAVHTEYKEAKDVTRKRIYLETMEELFAGMNKVIIDSSAQSSQGVVPYLPLPALERARGQQENQ